MAYMNLHWKRGCLWITLLLLAMLPALTGCQQTRAPLNRYQVTSLELFDTVTTLTGYAESEEAFNRQADRILDNLREYHQLFDIYHTYEGVTNLKSINDTAGGSPLAVDIRLMNCLLLARQLCEQSGGKVDVTLGPVLKLWHEKREAGIASPETAALPAEEALREAHAHCGFDKVEINEAAGTVRLTDPVASLDLGCIAKGYAAGQVAKGLEGSWLLNLGGNVVATGPKPDGAAWAVGIQQPDGTGSDFLHVVTLESGAVVTSGDYQRYYQVDGKRYHHIIDPDTLYPADKWRAATVLAEDSGVADALSTALFLLGEEQGRQLLAAWGAEGLWVTGEGKVIYTDGYAARMQQ